MVTDRHQSNDKAEEKRGLSEQTNSLQNHVIDLRTNGNHFASTRDSQTTAESLLPKLQLSNSNKEMTPQLAANEGPYQALKNQHPDWDHSKLKQEARDIKQQTGRESFSKGEQFRKNDDGSVTTRLETNGKYLEKTSKDGKLVSQNDSPIEVKSKEAAAKKEWTVAIDLSATLPGADRSPKGFGVDNKLDYLKQLAKETEGKSVNILIHADRTVGKNNKFCHDDKRPLSNKEANACDLNATEKNLSKSENYFIHDGKIDKLPDSKSKSSQEDIKNLLKTASELSPSDKIALIIQSHGMGAAGIKTNRGDLTLSDTTKGIEAGLKGSGHEKLDFLDFDACNMSSVPVLDKTAKIAKNLVASAASEAAGHPTEKGDGQNLKAALQSLFNNPQQSGRDLAAGFVELAKNGENKEGKTNNTSTLASFDLSKYDEFKQGLDKFGNDLKKLSGASNIHALHDAINQTVRPETEEEEFRSHERDLKQFATNTLSAIDQGKLKTDNDDLKLSAHNFLKGLDALTINSFGDKDKGYENLGGLTANIPGSEILDKKELSRIISPLHDNLTQIKKLASDDLHFSDKKDVQDTVDGLKELYPVLSGVKGNPLKRLSDARKTIDAARDNEQLAHSLKKIVSVVQDIENSPVGKQLARESQPDSSYIQSRFRREKKVEITPAWDAFIRKLEAGAR